MIRGKFLSSMDEGAAVALALRASVFGCERDRHDDMALYALALDAQEQPSGSGRLYIEDDRFVLDGVGVLPERRGQGLGDLLMRMLLYRALELNAPAVYARAPGSAVRFCARYGLTPQGKIAPDGTFLLSAAAEQVNLEGSCHRCQDCEGDCAECPNS